MGFLIGLLLLILFLKVFVGIGVGIFKLLLGVLFVVILFTIAPLGFLAIGLIVPVIILVAIFGIIGFILKLIF